MENESELSEKLEECEQKKTIKVKPFGGPLLAQTYVCIVGHFEELLLGFVLQGDFQQSAEFL